MCEPVAGCDTHTRSAAHPDHYRKFHPTMAKNQRTITVVEATPDANGHTTFAIELEPGIEVSEPRWTGGAEGEGRWSITVRFVHDSVVVRERDRGTIEMEAAFLEHDPEYGKSRPRTGTHSRVQAILLAQDALLRDYRRRRDIGETLDHANVFEEGRATLSQVFHHIRRSQVLGGNAKQRGHYDFLMDLALYVWGPNKVAADLDQSDVDYLFARRCGIKRAKITEVYQFPEGDGPGVVFPEAFGRQRRRIAPCEPWTAKSNLMELSTIFEAATKLRVEGKILLQTNPLAPWDFSDAERGERPAWHPERFFRTVPHCDTVDPTGAARFRLVLHYHTGQRASTIERLRVHDFRFAEIDILDAFEEMRCLNAIRTGEKPAAEWARVWAVEHGGHGAVYLRHLKAKGGRFQRTVPINRHVRSEYERYMARRRELEVESEWLFPDPSDPTRPFSANEFSLLLREVEALAREECEREGIHPDLYLRQVRGNILHPYRATWENLRDDLGWIDNKNSAYVGGWTTRIRAAGVQGQTYRKLKAHYMLAVAEGRKLIEVLEESREADRARDYAMRDVPEGVTTESERLAA